MAEAGEVVVRIAPENTLHPGSWLRYVIATMLAPYKSGEGQHLATGIADGADEFAEDTDLWYTVR